MGCKNSTASASRMEELQKNNTGTMKYLFGPPRTETAANRLPVGFKFKTAMVPVASKETANPSGVDTLILEGGGKKGMCYAGVCDYLAEAGCLSHIRRFGATSVGTIWASVMAMGISPKRAKEFAEKTEWDKVLVDSLCNPFEGYGIFEGVAIYELLGGLYEELTGYKDITFEQLYKHYGRELCVVATDVSSANPVIFHPKTYPNMAIRRAVRYSIGVPLGMAAWQEPSADGTMHYMVDGVLVNNLPMHAFDGWFLSMKPEDAFFLRFAELLENPKSSRQNLAELALGQRASNQTKEERARTVGVKLMAFEEGVDVMRVSLSDKERDTKPVFPDTKLAKAYEEARKKDSDEKKLTLEEFSQMTKILAELNPEGGAIKKEKCAKLLDHPFIQRRYKSQIQKKGKEKFNEEFLFNLDFDGDGNVTWSEFCNYFSSFGLDEPGLFFGGHMNRPVTSFAGFMMNVVEAMQRSTDREMYSIEDAGRIIKVDTAYVDSGSTLEPLDIAFCFQQGYVATKHWFQVQKDEEESSVFSSLKKIIS